MVEAYQAEAFIQKGLWACHKPSHTAYYGTACSWQNHVQQAAGPVLTSVYSCDAIDLPPRMTSDAACIFCS